VLSEAVGDIVTAKGLGKKPVHRGRREAAIYAYSGLDTRWRAAPEFY
jgi:hypothetical protein